MIQVLGKVENTAHSIHERQQQLAQIVEVIGLVDVLPSARGAKA